MTTPKVEGESSTTLAGPSEWPQAERPGSQQTQPPRVPCWPSRAEEGGGGHTEHIPNRG